jgi:hypothetical protein
MSAVIPAFRGAVLHVCRIEIFLYSEGLPVRTKKIMDKHRLIVIKYLCGGIPVTIIHLSVFGL